MGGTSQTGKAGGGRLAALTGWIDDRFLYLRLRLVP